MPQVKVSINSKVGLGDVWKLVGSCPELGRMRPEVAPTMQWQNGDRWVYEGPLCQGTIEYKLVLRNAEGAYIWEEGSNRELTVGGGGVRVWAQREGGRKGRGG